MKILQINCKQLKIFLQYYSRSKMYKKWSNLTNVFDLDKAHWRSSCSEDIIYYIYMIYYRHPFVCLHSHNYIVAATYMCHIFLIWHLLYVWKVYSERRRHVPKIYIRHFNMIRYAQFLSDRKNMFWNKFLEVASTACIYISVFS